MVEGLSGRKGGLDDAPAPLPHEPSGMDIPAFTG